MRQTLDDATHAVALTTADVRSLMQEEVVDVVTVPDLSEHLNCADTPREFRPGRSSTSGRSSNASTG